MKTLIAFIIAVTFLNYGISFHQAIRIAAIQKAIDTQPKQFVFGPIGVGDLVVCQREREIGRVTAIANDSAWVLFPRSSYPSTVKIEDLARAVPKE